MLLTYTTVNQKRNTMKKLVFLLLIPFVSWSQKSDRTFNRLNFQLLNEEQNTFAFSREITPDQRLLIGNKTLVRTSTNQKNKEKSRFEMQFNPFGRITDFSSKNWHVTYQYEQDTLLASTENKGKKRHFSSKRTYNDQGKLTSIVTKKNGKLSTETYFTYSPSGKVTSKELREKKHVYLIKHTYNEEDKLNETVYFLDGKLKKRWYYDCLPEGKIVANKTDETSSFCKSYNEFSSGEYEVIIRTIEKGKDVLIKSKYSKDSVMMDSKRFLHDTILVNHSIYTPNSKTHYIFSEKNGKFKYGYVQKLDDKGRTIERISMNGKKRKVTSSSLFEYNSEGILVRITNQYKKNKTYIQYTLL